MRRDAFDTFSIIDRADYRPPPPGMSTPPSTRIARAGEEDDIFT
jgi:hypothetical protein